MQIPAAALAACLALAGCGRPAPGPEHHAAPGAVVPAAPSSPPAARAPEIPDATSDVFHDGNWVRCYAGFSPGDTPRLDAMRLGLMCGPSNGMRRVPGESWDAKHGECYRVIAVGAPGVRGLDVVVSDASGHRLAAMRSDRRWAVLEPRGAFCVAADGRYRVEASAARGNGSIAVEVWRLR